MKKKALVFLFLLIISALIYLSYIGYLVPKSTTSILSPNVDFSSHAQPKRIVGFLPYWQMAAGATLEFPLLDEIIYFGLHVDGTGGILEKDENGNKDQGFAKINGNSFRELQNLAKASDTKISAAIILQDNKKVEDFLKDERTKRRAIEEISTLIRTYNLSGINMDFEYAGVPAKETIGAYSKFVEQLARELKKAYPNITVSVDVTADAIIRSRLYHIEDLAKSVDHVILMGYDFYKPGSSVAGPVAPLTGKELYEYDITTAVSDFLALMPREKLILGVPYYGWDFPTSSTDRGSFVEQRPGEGVALSSYRRSKKLISEGIESKIDTESQTPWMVYHDPDTNGVRQVWYEDEVSLGKKYDLVNRENLAGIAIWALGYDGDNPELTKLLKEKFRK